MPTPQALLQHPPHLHFEPITIRRQPKVEIKETMIDTLHRQRKSNAISYRAALTGIPRHRINLAHAIPSRSAVNATSPVPTDARSSPLNCMSYNRRYVPECCISSSWVPISVICP